MKLPILRSVLGSQLLHAVIAFAFVAIAQVWPSTAHAADAIRGGQLWDRWWTVNGASQPAGNHPLYPLAGLQSGSTTFRCKECHGWDYKGAAGAYGSGSHFTGIPGVFGSTLTAVEMTDIIKTTIVTNGHGFELYGLTDTDIADLVEFIQTLVIDTDLYVDSAKDFIGDAVQGRTNYESVSVPACTLCHGNEGTALNFATPDDPEWVGTIAVANPWELLHKIRVGNPGSSMPSWVENGGDDQGAADIGAFSQQSQPALSLCTDLPRTSCAQSAKAQLLIKKPVDPAKAKLKFKWTKGEAVDHADFGSPDTATNYALCLYDTDLAVVSVAPSIDVRPNAAWLSESPDGWQYKDKVGAYAGIEKVQLKPGTNEKAKVSVVGAGPGLPLPTAVAMDRFFAQDPSVTVQLVNEDEQCWTATFTTSTKNDGALYKAKLP